METTFRIPKRKRRAEPDPVERVNVPSSSSQDKTVKVPGKYAIIDTQKAIRREIIEKISKKPEDKKYPVDEIWKNLKVTDVQLISNERLERNFNAYKEKFKAEERLGYRIVYGKDEIEKIAQNGLSVKSDLVVHIANRNVGVLLYNSPALSYPGLCLYEDIPIKIMMFKVAFLKGQRITFDRNEKTLSPPSRLHVRTEFDLREFRKEMRDHILGGVYYYEMAANQFKQYPSMILPYAIITYEVSNKLKNKSINTVFPHFIPNNSERFEHRVIIGNTAYKGMMHNLECAKTAITIVTKDHVNPDCTRAVYYDKFPALNALRNIWCFGKLLTSESVFIESVGSLIYHPFKLESKSKSLWKLLRDRNSFLSWKEFDYNVFYLPSGPVAAEFGFPYAPGVLHMIVHRKITPFGPHNVKNGGVEHFNRTKQNLLLKLPENGAEPITPASPSPSTSNGTSSFPFPRRGTGIIKTQGSVSRKLKVTWPDEVRPGATLTYVRWIDNEAGPSGDAIKSLSFAERQKQEHLLEKKQQDDKLKEEKKQREAEGTDDIFKNAMAYSNHHRGSQEPEESASTSSSSRPARFVSMSPSSPPPPPPPRTLPPRFLPLPPPPLPPLPLPQLPASRVPIPTDFNRPPPSLGAVHSASNYPPLHRMPPPTMQLAPMGVPPPHFANRISTFNPIEPVGVPPPPPAVRNLPINIRISSNIALPSMSEPPPTFPAQLSTNAQSRQFPTKNGSTSASIPAPTLISLPQLARSSAPRPAQNNISALSIPLPPAPPVTATHTTNLPIVAETAHSIPLESEEKGEESMDVDDDDESQMEIDTVEVDPKTDGLSKGEGDKVIQEVEVIPIEAKKPVVEENDILLAVCQKTPVKIDIDQKNNTLQELLQQKTTSSNASSASSSFDTDFRRQSAGTSSSKDQGGAMPILQKLLSSNEAGDSQIMTATLPASTQDTDYRTMSRPPIQPNDRKQDIDERANRPPVSNQPTASQSQTNQFSGFLSCIPKLVNTLNIGNNPIMSTSSASSSNNSEPVRANGQQPSSSSTRSNNNAFKPRTFWEDMSQRGGTESSTQNGQEPGSSSTRKTPPEKSQKSNDLGSSAQQAKEEIDYIVLSSDEEEGEIVTDRPSRVRALVGGAAPPGITSRAQLQGNSNGSSSHSNLRIPVVDQTNGSNGLNLHNSGQQRLTHFTSLPGQQVNGNHSRASGGSDSNPTKSPYWMNSLKERGDKFAYNWLIFMDPYLTDRHRNPIDFNKVEKLFTKLQQMKATVPPATPRHHATVYIHPLQYENMAKTSPNMFRTFERFSRVTPTIVEVLPKHIGCDSHLIGLEQLSECMDAIRVHQNPYHSFFITNRYDSSEPTVHCMASKGITVSSIEKFIDFCENQDKC